MTMELDRISVLITGLGGGSHGMQIMKALKLSDLPYYFVGTDLSKKSFGLCFADKQYAVPLATHPEYIHTLADIIEKNDVKVIFHGSEPELKVLSKNERFFKEKGVFLPINPIDVIKLCMNKCETMKFLDNKGFHTPRTFLIATLKDIDVVDVYPVICKPHLGGGGSNNVFIAQNSKELHYISEYLLGYLKGFIVQEYIGTAESEYTVGVLADIEGHILGSIGVKRRLYSALTIRIKQKNRTFRKELGEMLIISSGISEGQIGRFTDICGYCEQVAVSLGAKGPVNFQCRVQDNNVYIFEVNPRFSGTTSLRAMAGFNEPDILIRRHVLNEKDPKIIIKEGLILRGLQENFIYDL